jgi:excisionase family DNA binding protein
MWVMATLADQLLTTQEVAAMLRITSSGVRMLVARGRLNPVKRGARPLMFQALDVERLVAQRQPTWHKADVAAAWAEVDALVPRSGTV